MRRLSTYLLPARDERGFTLIETLVAMFSAVVVVGALYAILDLSVAQTARVTGMVQASQTGRITITKISEELESACIAPGFTPVEVGSGENTKESQLVFVNAYTPSNEALIIKALKHVIVWEKSKGLLIDRQYKSNGGSWPEFSYPEKATGETRLGEGISETETSEIVAGKSVEKEIPIFRYYKYSKEPSSVKTESVLTTLKEIELEKKGTEQILTSTEAKETAAVEISFNQSSVDKYSREVPASFKTQITLSFSVPDAETPVEEKPCE